MISNEILVLFQTTPVAFAYFGYLLEWLCLRILQLLDSFSFLGNTGARRLSFLVSWKSLHVIDPRFTAFLILLATTPLLDKLITFCEVGSSFRVHFLGAIVTLYKKKHSVSCLLYL